MTSEDKLAIPSVTKRRIYKRLVAPTDRLRADLACYELVEIALHKAEDRIAQLDVEIDAKDAEIAILKRGMRSHPNLGRSGNA